MGSGKVGAICLLGVLGVAGAGCSKGPRSNAATPYDRSPTSPTATTATSPATAASPVTTTDFEPALAAATSASTRRVTSTPDSARAPSQAVTTRDAFIEFGEETEVHDVEAEPEAEMLFVVEADGTFRVLDTSAERPALVRAFPLFPEPLGRERSLGQLAVVRPDLALLPTQGAGFEGVALFDPSEARSSDDVTWFDVGALSATWPAGATNSQGIDVGQRPLLLTEVSGATVVGDTVFLCAANLDADGDHNPGVVVALRLDAAARRLEPRALIRTSAFNPTGLTRIGDLLFVTNTGSFGQTGASVDVIDVRSARRLDTIAFPERLADGRVPDPYGPLVMQPGGRSAYVGSLQQARVYTVDLQGRAFVKDVALPSAATQNSTRELALSQDGATLFAANTAAGAVNAIDIASERVTEVAARNADEGKVQDFVIQPTRDGGVAMLAVVNDVPSDAQKKPGVRSSLDQVQLPDRAAATLPR